MSESPQGPVVLAPSGPAPAPACAPPVAPTPPAPAAQAPAAPAPPTTAPVTAPALVPSLLVDGAEAARLLAIGKSLFYALLASGRFGPRPLKLGRATRVSRIELQQWIDAGCPPRARWDAMRGGRR